GGCAVSAEFPRNSRTPPTCRRNERERSVALLPHQRFLPPLSFRAGCSVRLCRRCCCFGAAPIPPALLPLLASLANAENASKTLRRFSALARLARADRAVVSRCAAKRPGNSCAKDIRGQETRRN